MWGPAFPKTRDLISTWEESRATVARQYLSVIDYHLSFTDAAHSRSSAALHEFTVHPSGTDPAEYYISWRNPLELVRWGDIAVREAATVFDVTWVASNNWLRLGLSQKSPAAFRWRDQKAPGPFQKAVATLGVPGAAVLRDAMDRIFESIGFELLQGYRNWVTHRGAPIQHPPDPFLGPIPIPDAVLSETDPDRRQFRHHTAAIEHVDETLSVTCAPFVPSVQQAYSAHIGEVEQPTMLPGGILIGPGAHDITIKNARVVSGDLLDRADDYRARNPSSLHQGQETLAGEDLVTYSSGDYIMAVGFVSRFVSQAVDSLDVPLRTTLEQSNR